MMRISRLNWGLPVGNICVVLLTTGLEGPCAVVEPYILGRSGRKSVLLPIYHTTSEIIHHG